MFLIKISHTARAGYPDVYTPEAVSALEALSPLDTGRDGTRITRNLDFDTHTATREATVQ